MLQNALPLTVLLGKSEREDRSLRLYDPGEVSFLTGEGIGLSCKAEIRWAVLGFSVPIQLRALTVVLSPRMSLRDGQPTLVFGLSLERVDLAGVPARWDGKLVDLINQALQDRQVELAWGFGSTLTHAFELPSMLSSLQSFNLGVGESSVEVLPDALRLDITLQASVTRR